MIYTNWFLFLYVPYKRNELPDASMSAHIDRDCKSDPAEVLYLLIIYFLFFK